MPLPHELSFLYADTVTAAKQLLGCMLERTTADGTIQVRIVETEAYHQSDAASHSYSGETVRNSPMFQEAGVFYVYFTYGMHYCANIVTGQAGEGSGVLIRAVEPLAGEHIIRQNRPNVTAPQTTNGPAKLCQALQINKQLSGHDITKRPLILRTGALQTPETITQTTRIGISKAVDMPWRFYIKGNPYISKK